MRPIDPIQTERVDLNGVIRDKVDITHPKWKTGLGLSTVWGLVTGLGGPDHDRERAGGGRASPFLIV